MDKEKEIDYFLAKLYKVAKIPKKAFKDTRSNSQNDVKFKKMLERWLK